MPDLCLITIPGLEVGDWRVVHDRLLDQFPHVTDVLATTMKETILVVCEDAASGDAGRWLDTVSETIANCRRSRSSPRRVTGSHRGQPGSSRRRSFGGAQPVALVR